MGLTSVMHTALSGMSAASVAVEVAGNNLANANTDGFKQSVAHFTPQTPATLSLGSADGGGRNPVQIGTGVQVAEIASDSSQGALVPGSSPFDLALEGEGLFILRTAGGEQLYTRDGHFRLDGNGGLVNQQGDRVLGFPADGGFNIQTGNLQPLRIPVGSTVAGANGLPATLASVSIRRDGRVQGLYTDGVTRDLGQIQIARFANPGGLVRRGQNRFAVGPNSGLPVTAAPGNMGAATLAAGATELSNTDIGENLVALMLASTQFRASRVVLDTSDQLLEELTNLRR
jgi:flagellar hook protein FlgE